MLFPLLTTVLAGATLQPLHAARADASSFLRSDWNKFEENYHPSYVLDDDPKTAWVEGRPDDGIGESIFIETSTVSRVRTLRLGIKNGYQKSEKLLEANSAPAQVTVIVLNDGGTEVTRQKATLTRTMGVQDIDIALNGKPLAAVMIEIDAVHPGRVYRDTCISDIAISIDSDVPYNAKAERAKQEALFAWKANRVRAAAAYKKDPASWPWGTTTLSTEEADAQSFAALDIAGKPLPAFLTADTLLSIAPAATLAEFGTDGRAALRRLTELRGQRAAQAPTAAARKRLAPAKHHHPIPDGLWLQAPLQALLKRSDVVLVEGAGAAKSAAPPEERLVSFGGPHAVGEVEVDDVVVDGDDVLLTVTIDTLERVRTVEKAVWLLRYDPAGRLSIVAMVSRESITRGYMLEQVKPSDLETTEGLGERVRIIRFGRDAAGKIIGVDDVVGELGVAPCCIDDPTPEDEQVRFRVRCQRAS
jgi:hypothetical protein